MGSKRIQPRSSQTKGSLAGVLHHEHVEVEHEDGSISHGKVDAIATRRTKGTGIVVSLYPNGERYEEEWKPSGMKVKRQNPHRPSRNITLQVKTLDGKTTPIAKLSRQDTVAYLKQCFENATGVQTCSQRIIHAGTQLENTQTLQDYNLSDGDEVHMVFRLGILLHKVEDPPPPPSLKLTLI